MIEKTIIEQEYKVHQVLRGFKDLGEQGIQGIQGPSGVNGTQGPPGEQGPAGPGINASSFYKVEGEISNSVNLASSASCDEGDIAISGEFELSNPEGGIVSAEIVIFESVGSFPSDTWRTNLNSVLGDTRVTTSAICLDNPPLRP